jgi:hypothetical protein
MDLHALFILSSHLITLNAHAINKLLTGQATHGFDTLRE